MPSRSSKSRKASLSQARTPTQTTANSQAANREYRLITPATTDTPNHHSNSSAPSPPISPQNWPPTLPYLTHPIVSRYLPPTHTKWLRHRPQDADLPTITFPLSPSDIRSRVEIRLIDDVGHPAFGQRGLFAAKDLRPGELVVAYLGYVHGATGVERAEWEKVRVRRMEEGDASGQGNGADVSDLEESTRADQVGSEMDEEEIPLSSESQAQEHPHNADAHVGAAADDTSNDLNEDQMIGSWDTSSYDLNMYRSEDIEIAVDAAQMGNEARFVNDYRGVPVSLSTSTSAQATGTNNERKEKRKVKVNLKEQKSQDVAAVQDEEGEGEGAWQTSWHYDNSVNIAMPNAEFRDVWFDIQEDVDLSLDSISAKTRVSMSSGSQNRKPDADDRETSPTELSLPPILDNLNLKEHSQLEILEERSGARLPQRKRKPGVRGVAIFVMPAGKAGKRKHGIRKGQEILVSYGKGFWAHHGSDL